MPELEKRNTETRIDRVLHQWNSRHAESWENGNVFIISVRDKRLATDLYSLFSNSLHQILDVDSGVPNFIGAALVTFPKASGGIVYELHDSYWLRNDSDIYGELDNETKGTATAYMASMVERACVARWRV